MFQTVPNVQAHRRHVRAERTVELVLDAFKAVERRDAQRLLELYHPHVSFHWPPELPYGRTERPAELADPAGPGPNPTWSGTWDPLQPTEVERRMDPRVVGASDTEVVVLWHQRGRSQRGRRFDSLVIGVYEVRDEKFYRAQMFYFDPAGTRQFIEEATAETGLFLPAGV
jgi:ketosteroid isomerase-like protein